MDEEESVYDRISRKWAASGRRNSVVSLERNSGLNRHPSLKAKHSIIQYLAG